MSQRPPCGATVRLGGPAARAAASVRTDPDSLPVRVVATVMCALETHPDERQHTGVVRHLPLQCAGEIWAGWYENGQPHEIIERLYCFAAPDDGSDACTHYVSHPGAHSWMLAVPSSRRP
jgi:hypothetical protein